MEHKILKVASRGHTIKMEGIKLYEPYRVIDRMKVIIVLTNKNYKCG